MDWVPGPRLGPEVETMWLVGGRKQRLARVLARVRESGREKLARIAWDEGWSYKYMRYSVLPELLAITECIKYDKASDELVWVCDGGEQDG